MLLTAEERQLIFESDLKKISTYLIERFNLDIKKNPDSMYFKSTALTMEYIILADKKELNKLSGKGTIDELKTFNDQMWDKLKMFSIRAFTIHNNKIRVQIDYKRDIGIITYPAGHNETTELTYY
ncbi:MULTISPECIES: hypothetical protein [Methanobacterium]|uniref:Uncharacterized protein n=1 Tax=Methanobacterium bryantii TaxID=2161 RepID=A0A2A2H8Z4_METBR|nr:MULTISPECIES: hypothetical protein [Methanobacterium]OEC85683.1 hypothetical protein A9507_13075 [Methanobacterium sp. A39]PAV05882.1 hypothetical protein ASJ80_13545 [Methanobacterium bryantii]